MPRLVRFSFYVRQLLEQLDGGLAEELRDHVTEMAESPAQHFRSPRGDEPQEVSVLKYASDFDSTMRFRLYFHESDDGDALVLIVIGHTSLPPEFEAPD